MSASVAIRRQVLRRVRYATNTIALQDNRVPPEGAFDAALTNGLLAIVADEFPGQEFQPSHANRLRPASELLTVIEGLGTITLANVEVLREGLALTQPARHGRADDEFAVITTAHLNALADLDPHPALQFLDSARGLSVDEAVVVAFRERAAEELPFDLKDRMLVPEPEECPECWRETFLPSAWDEFGGTTTSGECIACGYLRTEIEAHDLALSEALDRYLTEDS